MSLAAHTRLGPYEILDLIGTGGMGEVYKANDTRLDRTVAIKILPRRLSDPEHRARFEREAKTVAGLSHPHICTLYDVGQEGSSLFLVMEHLVGETIAERLRNGALPIEQAVDIGAQIGDALSAAHRAGVVHRDLKPGNVMLTKTGAKLLDFGLARLRTPEPAAALAVTATQLQPLTGEGTILGTVQYMAPEQIEGQEADARTDIWALGLVLYEMVTGKRAFDAPSSATLLAAILERQPSPPSALQPLTPPWIDRVILQCLAKSPEDRPDSAHDVANELRWIADTARALTTPGRGKTRMRPREIVAWTVAVVTIVAAAWGMRARAHPAPTAPVYMTMSLDTPPAVTAGQYAHFAMSPDGRAPIFKRDRVLVRQPLDAFSASPIDGTGGARFPAFKPDGTALAFWADGAIKRVAITGGPVTVLARAWVSGGMDWGEDDFIYYGAGRIWRVAAGSGGQPEAVTQVDDRAGENAHAWPQLLPGGKALVFTALGASGGSDDARVMVQVLESKTRSTLVQGGMFGRYLDSGHLLYARNDGSVYAARFDAARLEAMGKPISVLSDVGTATWGGQAFLSVSRTGTLAFLKRSFRREAIFKLVDASGRQVTGPFALEDGAARLRMTVGPLTPLARGGDRFALTVRNAGVADIWTIDGRSGEAERLTFDPAEDEGPVWSPDGKSVAYTSAQTATTRRIFVKSIETGAPPKVIRTWPRHLHVTSWSPDGRWLAAMDYTATNSTDIWAIEVGGDAAMPVANSTAAEGWAQFSPDGRWIAYVSDESARPEVYVISFPSLGSRHQVSSDGGTRPRWDDAGHVLYYLQNGHLVSQEVQLSATFSKGRVRQLFDTPATSFEVAPGGRFVLGEPNKEPADTSLYVILNWFEELKAKVPGK